MITKEQFLILVLFVVCIFLGLIAMKKENDVIDYKYFKDIDKHPFQKFNKAQKKTTDFETNYDRLISKDNISLIAQLLQLIMDKDFANTTYICQNSNSTTFVSYGIILVSTK